MALLRARGRLVLGTALSAVLGATPATAAEGGSGAQCDEAAALALAACAASVAADLEAGLADCASAVGDERRACIVAARAARVEALAACYQQHVAVVQTCRGPGARQ